MKPVSIKKIITLCRESAENKKATDITILDLKKLPTFTDYFLICSAQSEPQLKAIAQEIERNVHEETGRKPYAVEGTPMSHWMILDYGDLIIHIFHEKMRQHYALEQLWGDAEWRKR
ncbi:MAG: ribosome silencing factor [Verrucomicrobiia bacterium]